MVVFWIFVGGLCYNSVWLCFCLSLICVGCFGGCCRCSWLVLLGLVCGCFSFGWFVVVVFSYVD